jgi:hypothetical protein
VELERVAVRGEDEGLVKRFGIVERLRYADQAKRLTTQLLVRSFALMPMSWWRMARNRTVAPVCPTQKYPIPRRLRSG